MPVVIHDLEKLEPMRLACRLAAEVLDYITPHVVAGVTTATLNKLCHDYIVNVQQAIPAPLNYAPGGHIPYPASVCTSVNHVICHGIPSDYVLKQGDIINIDVTVIKNGWYGDTSRMFFVGRVEQHAKRVCDVAFQSMWAGINQVKPDATLGDVGAAIQEMAERAGYSIVREYCGHGIGRTFHDDPQVLHYGKRGTGLKLRPGMIFTIEPMLNIGKRESRVLNDGWTVVTKDRSLSAQWEHTVLVTPNGFEVLTVSPLSKSNPML
jgi:methionyl aminopeptidase